MDIKDFDKYFARLSREVQQAISADTPNHYVYVDAELPAADVEVLHGVYMYGVEGLYISDINCAEYFTAAS